MNVAALVDSSLGFFDEAEQTNPTKNALKNRKEKQAGLYLRGLSDVRKISIVIEAGLVY